MLGATMAAGHKHVRTYCDLTESSASSHIQRVRGARAFGLRDRPFR
jgi:hypothetical protein